LSFGIYCQWPPADKPPVVSLPQPLKYVLAKRLWGHDGSLRGEAILGKDSVEYLQGICDASDPDGDVAKGAKMLMTLIRRHGDMKLWVGEWYDGPGDNNGQVIPSSELPPDFF
jgi:hypothetical protein